MLKSSHTFATLPMNHDQAFKNLFLDYPIAALELFAEVEAQALRTAHITPIREQQLKERLGERFRELDVPLLIEWANGQREAVLFVLEEDTEPKNFSIHRLAHYCLDLAELMKTERVVPVVVFLRKGHFAKELHLSGDSNVYLSFRFLYCELAKLPAENYLNSPNIVARLNLPNMRFAPEQKLDVYAHAMQGLSDLESNWNLQRKYADFIDAYADLSEDDVVRYRTDYIDNKGEPTMGLVATLLEEGRQQGKQQGVLQGESVLLRRQLVRRFGVLPSWAEVRLTDADTEQLERWGEQLLDATTLEAVFREA